MALWVLRSVPRGRSSSCYC